MNTIRIGSRESKLAVIQSELVMDAIRAAMQMQMTREEGTAMTNRYLGMK